MKCFCWHSQWFKMSNVFLSVCLQFKHMYVSSAANDPGFFRVQTRSATCAMTTDQPPAAADCICCIPSKAEGIFVCLGTLKHENTCVPASEGWKCKGCDSFTWIKTQWLCHLWLPYVKLLGAQRDCITNFISSVIPSYLALLCARAGYSHIFFLPCVYPALCTSLSFLLSHVVFHFISVLPTFIFLCSIYSTLWLPACVC